MTGEIVPGPEIRYYARIADDTREISVHSGGLVVDGEPVEADMSTLPGSDRHHLRLGGRSLSLFARRGAGGWLVELEGRLFEVAVEDERTRHIRELASHAAPAETRRDLLAPMPGLIVRVEVGVGQEVDAGDSLVVMEAMKMENELRADAPGRVLSIEVAPGQAVERDAVLLKLERR
jgi:biotin carboxyl carrier protein